MAVIPFSGTSHPEFFGIETPAMDRHGRVIERLDARLPGRGHRLSYRVGLFHSRSRGPS